MRLLRPRPPNAPRLVVSAQGTSRSGRFLPPHPPGPVFGWRARSFGLGSLPLGGGPFSWPLLCLPCLAAGVGGPTAGAQHIIDDAAGVLDDILHSPAGGLTELADSLLQAAAHRFDGCSSAPPPRGSAMIISASCHGRRDPNNLRKLVPAPRDKSSRSARLTNSC